jgi:hypothetical protein
VRPDQKKAVQLLLWSLKPFAALRTMPLNYVIAFLLVALEEGQTPSTYARALGINRWIMLAVSTNSAPTSRVAALTGRVWDL